jgi:hypothetical protein
VRRVLRQGQLRANITLYITYEHEVTGAKPLDILSLTNKQIPVQLTVFHTQNAFDNNLIVKILYNMKL